MSMATASKHWTIDLVRTIPSDGNRYEIIDGELFVTPAPSWTHQAAVLELAVMLRRHLEGEPLGKVVIAPADVEFSPDTMVEPDLFVVPLVAGRAPRNWSEVGRLLLAVEVLSPATARVDRVRKRALYARERVPEYWIVDVDARVIERWRPEDERPEVVTERLEWRPDAAHPPLTVDLPTYFAAVTGSVSS